MNLINRCPRIHGAFAGVMLVLAAHALSPSPAAGQTPPDRIFVNLGGGYQAMSTTFGESHSEPLDGETSTWDARYSLEDGVGFMGGFGVRVWRNLVAGVTYSHQQQNSPARVTGRIPHPFFFDQPRALEGESSSLEHRERALHISAAWIAPISDRVELTVSGGPTLFSIARGFVDGLQYTQEYPYDVVTFIDIDEQEVTERTLGAHAAAELTWLVTPHVGISGIVRYSHGSIGLETPSGNTVSLDAGGLQAGVALRLGFGAASSRPAAPPPRPPSPRVDVPPAAPPIAQYDQGVILAAAPVYLKPDRARTPLRVLEAGTMVKILDAEGEWLRIEFADPQFGPRFGYVAKGLVRQYK
jgi:hypothetical protein